MAAMAAEMTQMWAGQLADLTDHVIKELPEAEEWKAIRHFLSNTSRLLRNGDVKSGFKAVMKILPYVQCVISNVEKYKNINSSFDLTEAITNHFLVDERHKDFINERLQDVEVHIAELRLRVTKLATRLDTALDDVIGGTSLSWWRALSFAFEINRTSALTRTCEEKLKHVRGLLDDLDGHVAGKSFIAHVFMYLAFLFGVAFTATGNVPVGAACMSAATAGRKAAKSLAAYRSDLDALDRKHTSLQAELSEWKNRFAAEQKNFLCLFGVKKTLVVLIAVFITLALVGRRGNIVLFCALVGCLLMTSYSAQSNQSNAALAYACFAAWMECSQMYGLLLFNFSAFLLLLATNVGNLEMWYS